MRMKVLQKKHPDFWVTVEASVWDDLNQALPKPSLLMTKIMRRVAYNAAAISTYAHDKRLKGIQLNVEQMIRDLVKAFHKEAKKK